MYINRRHGNNASDWFILKFVLPYTSPGYAVITTAVALTYGKHQPFPSCHFLPLYFLCHDGGLMALSIPQCPCPLERSPQVIRRVACGPEFDVGPMESQQDIDCKCSWQLYLYSFLSFIRKKRLSSNGLFTHTLIF